MNVALTTDHNGVALKEHIAAWLRERGYQVDDRSPATSTVGPATSAATQAAGPVDYPPLCEDACRRVTGGEARFAIVVGGSGQGEQIACNKMRGIRAALCNEPFTTQIARAHNDANVMVIGAKLVSAAAVVELLAIWFDTVFKGGPHQARVDQITALERGESLL